MGIVLVKILKRIFSYVKKLIWNIFYFGRISIGKNVIFYSDTHIVIDEKGVLKIGDNCFFNNGCALNALGCIEIGKDSIFGENVKVYDHNHRFELNGVPFKKQGYDVKKVVIGNNCWIGSNTVILAGVTIGDNVVIGAGSIITKDIKDNQVVVQEIKQRNLKREN